MPDRDVAPRSLVMFDFDGTLADTWDGVAEEIVAGAPALGYRAVSREELEGLRSLGTREIFQALGIPLWRLPRVAGYLRRRAEARMGEIRLFEGAPELIEAVRAAGSAVAVVSSNSETVVRHALGDRLMPHIEQVSCGGAIFGKAARLKRVLRNSGALRSRAVFVGDEMRDLDAAEAAGIRGLAVEWGFASPTLLRDAAPGRTAASMADLGRMLGVGGGETPAQGLRGSESGAGEGGTASNDAP